MSKKEEVEYECFPLMFLGDINLNTICLIVEDIHVKTSIMEFWEENHLGNVLKIINPVVTGCFNDMAVLKC